MKIEMGESLFYSWLRHVKECQIVQMNWKLSSRWELMNGEELNSFINKFDTHFKRKYGYQVFKHNASWMQILQQGECDVIGVSFRKEEINLYAVDVAFHGAGLNYGTKDETIMKVIAKCVRTAAALYGYLDAREAEIIFASPKIHPAILRELVPCIQDINCIFRESGFAFSARLICNDEFESAVLKPICLLSDDIADTSELFVRSYQMFTMFNHKPKNNSAEGKLPVSQHRAAATVAIPAAAVSDAAGRLDPYRNLKIGQLARNVFAKMLENGCATDDEIRFMQQAEYSRQFFHLNYPVLILAARPHNPARYYATPLLIKGTAYLLCNDWYENATNNDRPYLLKWINDHQRK